MGMDELVDILKPPAFEKTGEIKTKDQAYDDGNWIATFNLWIFQTLPVPAILFQQRGENATIEPNKLDVTAGGHYISGETVYHGLREAEEELGRIYKREDVIYLGRKIYLGIDGKMRLRHNIVSVFCVVDNTPIDKYKLQKSEVTALFICPIQDMLKLNHKRNHAFTAQGINNLGQKITAKVNQNLFCYNFDDYHFKIGAIAKRVIEGERDGLI